MAAATRPTSSHYSTARSTAASGSRRAPNCGGSLSVHAHPLGAPRSHRRRGSFHPRAHFARTSERVWRTADDRRRRISTLPTGPAIPPGGSRRASPRRRSAIWATRSASLAKARSSREPLPELDHEPVAVEVAVPVEQVRLDPPFGAAVVRVDADRDRRAPLADRARVDPELAARACRARRGGSRSGSRACPRAGRRTTTVPSISSGRPSSCAARFDLSRRARARGSASTRRRRRAAPRAHRARATAAGRDRPRGCGRSGTPRRRRRPRRRSRPATSRANSSGDRSAISGVNSTTSMSSTPASASSSSRRSSVQSSSTRLPSTRPRMRVEGDHGRPQPRRRPPPDHGPMAQVDAVERADRNRPRQRLELAGLRATFTRLRPRALEREHAGATARARARAARRQALERDAGGHQPRRLDRPRLVDAERPDRRRRSVVQWPPSASAIARIYVPELTWSASARTTRGCVTAIGDDVERVDERTPQGHLQVDAPPRQPVRALTADLHRRGGRDRQLDLTPEALERRLHRARGPVPGAVRAPPLPGRRSTSLPSGRRR